MLDQLIPTVISAFVGGITASGVAWILNRSTANALRDLKKEVRDELKAKIDTVAAEAKAVKDNCMGKQLAANVDRNERRLEQIEAGNNAAAIQAAKTETALHNMTHAFGSFSVKLENYMDMTARQDVEIKNHDKRITGVREALRKHTDKED